MDCKKLHIPVFLFFEMKRARVLKDDAEEYPLRYFIVNLGIIECYLGGTMTRENFVYKAFKILQTLCSDGVQSIDKQHMLIGILLFAFPQKAGTSLLHLIRFDLQTITLYEDLYAFFQECDSWSVTELKRKWQKFNHVDILLGLAVLENFLTDLDTEQDVVIDTIIQICQYEYGCVSAMIHNKCALRQMLLDRIDEHISPHLPFETFRKMCDEDKTVSQICNAYSTFFNKF